MPDIHKAMLKHKIHANTSEAEEITAFVLDCINEKDDRDPLWDGPIDKEVDAHRAPVNTAATKEQIAEYKQLGLKILRGKLRKKIKRNQDRKTRITAGGYDESNVASTSTYGAPLANMVGWRNFLILLAYLSYVNKNEIQRGVDISERTRIRLYDVVSAYLLSPYIWPNKKESDPLPILKLPKAISRRIGYTYALCHHAVNGLKFGGYSWEVYRNRNFKELGLTMGKYDTSVFEFDSRVFITTHVDDLPCIGKPADLEELHKLILTKLPLKLEAVAISDTPAGLVEQHDVLGIIVKHNLSTGIIKFNQVDYINEVYKGYLARMEEVPLYQVPILRNVYSMPIETPTASERTDKLTVQGQLLWAARTRLDSVPGLCILASAPGGQECFLRLLTILNFLYHNPKELVFDASLEFNIVVQSDSDHATAKDRKSVSGIVVKVANCNVLASSKAQGPVADDSTEAELISAHTSLKRGSEVQNFIMSWSRLRKEFLLCAPRIHEIDNQAGVKFSKAPVPTARLKHLDIKYHKVRDEERKKRILVKWIPRDENAADLMTHAIDNGAEVRRKCNQMNLLDYEG